MKIFPFPYLILLAVLPCLALSDPREVLVAQYPPVTDCNPDDPLNAAEVKGIEVNILRQAFEEIGWVEGTDYYFNCTYWDDFFEVIETYSRPVLGAINGITISSDRLASGFKFSQPTMSTGMSLFYKKPDVDVFYIRSFDTVFLVLMVVLPFMVGFVIFFFQGCKAGIMNYVWYVLTIYFKCDDIHRINMESRLFSLAAKVMMMVVMVLYTAFTTNNLTFDNSFGGVTSVSDLRGLKVATLSYYANTIRSKGSIYQDFPDVWSTEDFLEAIRNTSASYIAYDAPIVTYVATLECDLYELLPNFYKYDFGFMMPNQVPAEDEAKVNEGLTMAFMKKTQTEYIDEYFKETLTDACTSKPALSLTYISFDSVKGLWYIWAVGVGISAGAMVFNMIKVFMKKKKNEYNFTGIRAEADQSIRAKVAAQLAIHLAISVGDIELERKELQKVYSKVLDRMQLDEKVYLRISETLSRDHDFKSLKHAYFTSNPSQSLIDLIKENKNSFIRQMSLKINKTPPGKLPSRPSAKIVSPLESPNGSFLTNKSDRKAGGGSSPSGSEVLPAAKRKNSKNPQEDVSYMGFLMDKTHNPRPHRVSKSSVLSDMFGIKEKKEHAYLKRINAEIIKIYKIPSSSIDSEMLESALVKMIHTKNKRDAKFQQQNYGLGPDFDFLITRRGGLFRQRPRDMFQGDDASDAPSIEYRRNDSLILSPQSSILPKQKKKFVMLIPSSQGPSRNILNHSFPSRSVLSPRTANLTMRMQSPDATLRIESPDVSLRFEQHDNTLRFEPPDNTFRFESPSGTMRLDFTPRETRRAFFSGSNYQP